MEGGILLDVVVGDGSSILKLSSCRDKSLGDSLNSKPFINLGFDGTDGVRWLDSEGDGLPGQSFHLDLNLRRASFHIEDLLDVAALAKVVVLKQHII